MGWLLPFRKNSSEASATTNARNAEMEVVTRSFRELSSFQERKRIEREKWHAKAEYPLLLAIG